MFYPRLNLLFQASVSCLTSPLVESNKGLVGQVTEEAE